MAGAPFIDTNIILRLLLVDNAVQSEAARTLFVRLERGDLKAQTSIAVIFEAVFILEKHYKFERSLIAEKLLGVLAIPHLQLRGKTLLGEVFDHYVTDNVSFIDAYHVVLMGQLNTKTIISYDHDFDRFPSIHRVEPAAAEEDDEAA